MSSTVRAQRSRRPARTIVALASVAAVLYGCGDDSESTSTADTGSDVTGPVIDPGDGGAYEPAIDPADFVDVIDNPYLPLLPGTRLVYDGAEQIEVLVTGERRMVMGVNTFVVRDTVSGDGEVVEDTDDWFAQDRDGNVWYFGEESKDYEGGELVSTAGSWEAGVDGAMPGIVMPATPAVGDAYRQEYYAGEAEDMFEITAIGGSGEVPAGSFAELVITNDWTPLEPAAVEEKTYAPGVGMIRSRYIAGGDDLVELVEYQQGG